MTGPRATTYEDVAGAGLFPAPVEVVRHLVDFLRWRFSKLPSGAYRFDENETDTEIFIGEDTPVDPVKIGMRPAITVLRSHLSFQGIGMGDRAFVDLKTGATAYMDMLPTTLMVNVLSKLPIESERLAWFCTKQIRAFRTVIIKTMPELLYIGQRPSISPPSPAGSLVQETTDFEWTVTVVAFPTFLQTAEHIYPLNRPILSQMRLNAQTASGSTLVKPTAMLQGTAVAQPALQIPEAGPQASGAESQASGADSGGALLQNGGDEAQSSEPLTVTIKT